MKYFLLSIITLWSFSAFAQKDTTPEIKHPVNKVESLKVDPQSPRHLDKEVTPSKKDNMPVLRSKEKESMPIKKTQPNEKMPVKELPDSTKK